MYCFCQHVWGVGRGEPDKDFGGTPVYSRDRGGHQNTCREGQIVKWHLYIIGRGMGGTHVRDKGRGLDGGLRGRVVFILYHKLVRNLFHCIVLSLPKASQNGKNHPPATPAPSPHLGPFAKTKSPVTLCLNPALVVVNLCSKHNHQPILNMEGDFSKIKIGLISLNKMERQRK